MIDKDLKKRIIHYALRIVGFLFLILGFLGLALPFLPGWLLIILGVAILGEEVAVSRFIIKRMPKSMQAKLEKIRSKFKKEKE